MSIRKLLNGCKFVEIMLVTLFLFAPFYYHQHIGGMGLRIPNNISVWFIANFIIWVSLYSCFKHSKIVTPKNIIYIVAFPVLATLSGFITGVDNPMQWLFRILFIWYGFLFFLALFQYNLSQYSIDRILFVIAVSALLQALAGVCQLFFSSDSLFWIPATKQNIPTGMFEQINNQAIYQVTGLIIAIYLITRPYLQSGKLWKKLLILSLFALGTFVISYSGSRAGILAFILAVPFAIGGRWPYFKRVKGLAISALVVSLIGGVLGSSGLVKVSDKIDHVANGYSTSARLGIYAVSADLIQEKPWFGHGIGSFKYKWQFGKADFYKENPEVHLIEGYVTHPHNEILFWAIESGMVAVLGIAIFVVGVTLSLSAKTQKRRGIYLALLLPVVVHTQVELPFYLSALHWFTALFILFVIMQNATRTIEMRLSSAALVVSRAVCLVMLTFGIIFFSHSLISSYELGHPMKNVWQTPNAQSNPYFSELVESVQMKSMVQYSMKHDISDGVESFTAWAEEYIPREPSANLFVLLALAYQDLERKNDMCRIMKIANGIYPYNKDFVSGMEFCFNVTKNVSK